VEAVKECRADVEKKKKKKQKNECFSPSQSCKKEQRERRSDTRLTQREGGDGGSG